MQVSDEQVTLAGIDEVLATCPAREVSVRPVRIWFGMGVRLDMGVAGKWYVQPRYGARPKAARLATEVLKEALAQARLA